MLDILDRAGAPIGRNGEKFLDRLRKGYGSSADAERGGAELQKAAAGVGHRSPIALWRQATLCALYDSDVEFFGYRSNRGKILT